MRKDHLTEAHGCSGKIKLEKLARRVILLDTVPYMYVRASFLKSCPFYLLYHNLYYYVTCTYLLGGNCIAHASVQLDFQYHMWLCFNICLTTVYMYMYHDRLVIYCPIYLLYHYFYSCSSCKHPSTHVAESHSKRAKINENTSASK